MKGRIETKHVVAGITRVTEEKLLITVTTATGTTLDLINRERLGGRRERQREREKRRDRERILSTNIKMHLIYNPSDNTLTVSSYIYWKKPQ